MSLTKKAKWMDVIGPANELSRTLGHMTPRRLEDLPMSVPAGAREVALVTIFAREQDFALKPVMEALEVLSKLDDWSHRFMAADRMHPHFDWKQSPLKKYGNFADFYAEELEATWGSWESLQTAWADIVAGRKTEAEVKAALAKARAARALALDEDDRANQVEQPKGGDRRSEAYRAARAQALDMAEADLFNQRRIKGSNAKKDARFDSRRPTTGSAAQALRKLRKDAPAIHARVLKGELSPHAGMVEAGFRKRRQRPKLTPLEKLRKAWAKCGGEERAIFLHEVDQGYDEDAMPSKKVTAKRLREIRIEFPEWPHDYEPIEYTCSKCGEHVWGEPGMSGRVAHVACGVFLIEKPE